MVRWIAALLLAQAVSGCAMFARDKETVSAPAELGRIDQPVKLAARWKTDVGDDDERFLNLVPAVDGQRVFAADYHGRVQARDLATGKRIWKSDAGEGVSAGPGVAEGIVLLGTNNGDVVALDGDTGKRLWSAPVTSEVLSIPVGSQGVAGIQTLSGDLVGLELASGERRWIYDRTVPALSLRGSSSPALYGGVVVGGFASGKLSAIAITNGRMLWEVSVAVPSGRSELERMVDIDASPKILNGAVFVVTYQGRLAVLELDTGRIIWTREMSSSAGLGVDYSQIYVTDEASHVWGLDQRNGASIWKQEGLQGRVLTAPEPFGEFVAVGDFEGYLHLLSRDDGKIVGRVRVDRKGIAATPVAVGDTLLVLGRGGELGAYEIRKPKTRKKNRRTSRRASEATAAAGTR